MKNTTRVLACHTNRAILKRISHMLNRAGMRTDCADDTGLAECLMSDNDYDVVLLDLFLADTDGISFAHTLNQAFPELPVLIFSRWPDPEKPVSPAVWPGWVDTYSRHVRLLFALKVMTGHIRQQQLILCIGEAHDCPVEISASLAQQASLVLARDPYELEEAISTNYFDLVIFSPDQDAGMARDNFRILMDSLMPLPVIIHPGPGAERVVELTRQAAELHVPLPRHKNCDTDHRPGPAVVSEFTDFKTSEGID